MTYPQPNSNQYCTNGYPFFRLQTPLVSPGDIYESEQGALAFALGPESDVARVTINYFDDQIPTRMNAVDISQDRLLSGKIFARNDTLYLPANRKGRILISVDDLYDPSWRPPGFDSDTDAIQFVTPVLDVLQYFSAPPNIAPQRADRRMYFQDYPFSGGNFYLVLPYWGRRYAYVQAKNPDDANIATFTAYGLSYAITDDSVAATAAKFHQLTTLLGPTTLAVSGGQLSPSPLIVTAGNQGMFDALVLEINVETVILKIVLSDVEES